MPPQRSRDTQPKRELWCSKVLHRKMTMSSDQADKALKGCHVWMVPTEYDPELIHHARASNTHWPKTKIVKVTQGIQQIDPSSAGKLDDLERDSDSKPSVLLRSKADFDAVVSALTTKFCRSSSKLAKEEQESERRRKNQSIREMIDRGEVDNGEDNGSE